ncbi:MAG: glycine--tRNA ligase [Candidatus Doudnabacteria bacterium RIFCSPHIGHO2_01_FULL_49_9]|uniref:Glycine--tRNA ligase n=1 Tax=Candidatus Doudnabacteria bacterium RIFCSPHIGHO2_01_FULL_49_9 TaxID=1817827 RepID=A0A1F5P0B1_9BACT|nr:MAG: glycine--tRNA ligase [Candidatus Doudnabacteria bacterium RIFCSPHIGHO2_01_FULL_49_9]
MQVSLEKIVNLCKRRGFIFPGSEIYGGLANSYDFGPLGTELKNNIKKLWWKMFVQEREDVVGLDAPIIMSSKVWEASGHLNNFNDELVECKKCHSRFRADELDSKACPNCKGTQFTSPQDFNTMFRTNLGPVEAPDHAVYLRPETAQAMFVDFGTIVETNRKKIPFGIAQIGKAFRNEITPGNFIFRLREFEQMEIEYFVKEGDWKKYFAEWESEIKRWIKAVGIDEKMVEYVDVPEKERAHYSKKTVDIEFKYPFGQKELYGLAYRTDFDLKAHGLEYRDPETGEKFVPHVIEPSLGVERTLLAVLLSCYEETEARSGKDDAVHETEITLRLPKAIAPVKIAILPLSRKDELTGPAEEIYKTLRAKWMCQYDETASIGKRYRRQDEIGTPYCVTVDFDSLEDKKVTVRDRDTMEQERIDIAELKSYFAGKLD